MINVLIDTTSVKYNIDARQYTVKKEYENIRD